ncbi:hypothetical protein L596_012751 [Steinernema carpocapsae]|uniref:Uncharacterized protein n=1 Tax=Steinernema carpocapsae TaxID=34508 RepID=A0A4U5NYX0_STECR|nr:hypothetical protein L596_012751 [Steinernema carpocapsae]
MYSSRNQPFVEICNLLPWIQQIVCFFVAVPSILFPYVPKTSTSTHIPTLLSTVPFLEHFFHTASSRISLSSSFLPFSFFCSSKLPHP